MGFYKASLLLALVVAAAAGPVNLTKENYKKEVEDSGKSAFVKFFAPWCGHCKSMKPAWDQLGGEFKDSTKILIGDVDCTSDGGKDICSENGVRGYPTLKYMGAGGGSFEDYQGGRDFAALKKFAEGLGPACSLANKDACKPEQLKFLEEWAAKSADDRAKEIERMEAEVKALNEAHEETTKKLQAEFQASKTKSEEGVATIKPSIGMLKSIKVGADGKAEL